MTESTAATRIVQQIGQNVTPAASLLCLCNSSARIWGLTELQGKQRRDVSLGNELHQATENTALVWRLCFSISKSLHKLITFCWVFQACSDGYTHSAWHCHGTCVWHCHAPFQLHFEDTTQSAEWRNPISGCADFLGPCSTQWWGSCTQQVTLVAVLQPRACHKAWDSSRKGVLLAQDPFRVNIIIFSVGAALASSSLGISAVFSITHCKYSPMAFIFPLFLLFKEAETISLAIVLGASKQGDNNAVKGQSAMVYFCKEKGKQLCHAAVPTDRWGEVETLLQVGCVQVTTKV